MPCPECGSETNTSTIVKRYDIPFKCSTCQSIKFLIQPLRDLIFLWPEKAPEQIKSILIPEKIREFYRNEYGVVLSVGKGYWTKSGKFEPTELKVGDEVVYDKQVPWAKEVEAPDGKKYHVKFMGEKDVKGLVVNEEPTAV